MVFKQVVYVTDKERTILNDRYCEHCGTHLVRGKGIGLEQWINTMFCCNKCMLSYRKELGLIQYNRDYKCRTVGPNNTYGVTVPAWFIRKYKVQDIYYKFEFTNGKFIIYTSTEKCRGAMKVRHSNRKDSIYMQIGIPSKIVKKYELQEKLFKFEDKGKNSLFYSKV